MELLTTGLIVLCIILGFALYKQNQKTAELERNTNKLALKMLEDFKQNEIQAVRNVMMGEAENMLQKWKLEQEFAIRQDAISKSKSVITGKVTEHLIPFFGEFPFNPKEARFIGSPIDLIIFEGIDDESEDIEIHFVEIKTGNSQLNKRQKLIRQAVWNQKVKWTEIKI
ncbi:MAG: Holliday junction resolvase-like protein [Candidatus Melainabacteria bacterium]|jgi:predicted Holliday junction resolvase-like endonuclease